MQILIEQHNFKIEYNGGETFFIVDRNGDCWDSVTTLRTAKNRFKKILANYNVEADFTNLKDPIKRA